LNGLYCVICQKRGVFRRGIVRIWKREVKRKIRTWTKENINENGDDER
jgi:hypothetical protein